MPKAQPKTKSGKNRTLLNDLVEKLLRTTVELPPENISSVNTWKAHVEVYELVQEIIAIENQIESNRGALKTRQTDVTEFLNFMKQNGATIHDSLRLVVSDEKRSELGFIATKPIDRDTCLMTIPQKLFLSSETDLPLLSKLAEIDPLIKHMSNIRLAMALICEKFVTKNSFWKPYLDVLPLTFSTIFYFDLADFEALKGSPVLKSVMKLYRHIARQYSHFYKSFQKSTDAYGSRLRGVFTYDKYRWAVSTVMTRENSLPTKKISEQITLIPLWDFFNHQNGPATTGFNDATKCIECTAMENYKTNEEVCIFYGQRTNCEFLVHNGFVFLENECDGYMLQMGFVKSDKLLNERQKLLEVLSPQFRPLGFPPKTEFLLKNTPKPFSEELLAFLRVFCMTEDQLRYWNENQKTVSSLSQIPDTGHDLDVKAWNYLKTRLEILLRSYPSTFDDDLKTIESEKENREISDCQLNVIKLRFCEQRILKNTLQYVNEQVVILG